MITTRRYAQSSASSTFSPLFHPAAPPQLPSSSGAAVAAVAAKHRPFHAGRACCLHNDAAQTQTHYETLNVPHDASVSDIKRSFYKLSKVHHPDHNPKDPHASRRFMRISEAYAVLGQADKRALYDRDVMRRTGRHPAAHHKHAAPPHRPNSSYHSTGPAGGRPASGLSKRRSTFKGPPPSFFKNMGSGAANSGTYSGTYSPHGNDASSQSAASGPTPGTAHPYDARANPETPHFDKVANERTQRRLDERLAARRAKAAGTDAEALAEPSMLLGFIVMSVAVMAGMVGPVLLFGDWKTKRTKTPKKSQE